MQTVEELRANPPRDSSAGWPVGPYPSAGIFPWAGAADREYPLMVAMSHLSDQNIAGNQMIGVPFVLGRGGTINRLAVRNILATAGGLLRVAIFDHNPTNFEPGALLVTTAAFDVSTLGRKSEDIAALTLAAATLYWAVFYANNPGGTFGLRCAQYGSWPILGYSPTDQATVNYIQRQRVWDGTMPATWPQAGSYATNANGAPCLFARFSEVV